MKTRAPLRASQIFTGTELEDIVLRKDFPNFGGDAGGVGQRMFGTLLDYPAAGTVTAGQVQYLRISLLKDEVYSDLRTFIDSGGSNAVEIRMGLYDQADPSSISGTPNTRVAQTAAVTTETFNNQFATLPIVGGNYVIPATGFYWLAVVTDGPQLKFAVSATHRANFLPVYREQLAPPNTDLPATTGTLTNPVSAVIFQSIIVA